MNRDEVLAKRRSENAGQDERELQICLKASHISKIAGLVLCLLVSFLASITLGNDNLISSACWTIFAGIWATEYLIKGFGLKKKSFLVGALCFTVCFVGFAYFFICDLYK